MLRASHGYGFVLLLACVAACARDTPVGPQQLSRGATVASILVTPDPAAVAVGDTILLHAAAHDSAGHTVSGVTVTWSVSDTLRAQISASGAVTGRSVGTDTVIASVGRVSARVPVETSVARAVLGVGGIGCILSPAGAASCWGSGLIAPLGNGTTATSTTPVSVSGKHVFSAIAVGVWNACALTRTGDAWCWGNGFDGAIGDDGDSTAVAPAAVPGGPYTAISVGFANACALAVGGQAYCWGDDNYGPLGNGTATTALTPTAVAGSLDLATISIGEDFACGVTVSGAGYCWGTNTLGSLGNGTSTSSFVPVPVAGALTWRRILVSDAVACGLTTSGAAYCWGLGSQVPAAAATEPRLISAALTFRSITLGGDQACGVSTSGTGYCWGANVYGERGTGGSTVATAVPAPVTGGLTFTDIAAGAWATCGRTTDGAIYCWGIELGTQPQKMTQSPVALVGPGST